ncbi:HAD family hydrolase [Chitinophaga sp. G-6-1-13]|uniref:HAD family hydrolase n=1 Tax=Chitinophaga fulva TaxID=2728842 RepID=A0A848GX37_9BACT|nr:HAD family hydrolase [Chitinophaga fulva]NML40218.1 HAD family hydrolase [Chitinophaga fulva]
MNNYQHYSFDLWLTLIRSNPSFKRERTKFFFDHFNQGKKSLEEVERIFRRIDLLTNAINEKTGGNIDTDTLHLMVISEINDHQYDFETVDLAALYNEMEALVFQYRPVVYCSATVGVLRTLHQRQDCTLSLLSNTAFIKGRTLRKVLQDLELGQYLHFQLYSDETGMSKPNPDMFRLMLDAIATTRNGEVIQPQQIIHIGDNVKADILGATEAGIHSLLVNSNNQCISSLLN